MHLVIVDADRNWPDAFSEIHQFFEPAFKNIECTIEHIGSTSVPGLCAKPVIDLDVVVATADDLGAATSAYERLGYLHNGDQGIVGLEAFSAPQTSTLALHHPYLVISGSAPHRDHVVFRDTLRSDVILRDAYGAIKKRAAAKALGDNDRYGASKGPFIEAVLEGRGHEFLEANSFEAV